MKRMVKAPENEEYVRVKDSDWFRFITRVEHQTGMKVDFESKHDRARETLVLTDKSGRKYEAEIEQVVYYNFDGKDLVPLSW